MLVLEHVHAHYGLSHVLQGVSLRVDSGEVVGLFGRNGVGKTTTLRSVAGWLTGISGTITFEGHSLRGLSPDRIARLGIAYVPEDRRIFPGLNVEENLKLGLMQRCSAERAPAKLKLAEVYERFPTLAERRRQQGTSLSGGEQQMLTIARALMGSPRLLLIDEPTEGLAPMIVNGIFKLLDELRREQLSIILVEQNVTRALQASDRFYALHRGQVILQGTSNSRRDCDALMETISV